MKTRSLLGAALAAAELLWHVLVHEMRHTAQVAVLVRTQGIEPPDLDLLFYLPSAY